MKLDLHSLLDKLNDIWATLRRYYVLIFLVFVFGLYGYLLFKINSLSNVQPSSDQLSSQTQTTVLPRIDPQVIKQLKDLQDNSVSVKSLFEQTRSNPFQE